GVSNNGPDTAVNVVFTLTIPSAASFTSFGSLVGFHPGDGCSNDFAGHISCHLASLASGSSASLHNLSANAVSPALLTLSNSVSSGTLDPIAANNTATTDVSILAHTADLVATVSAPASVKVGDAFLVDVG